MSRHTLLHHAQVETLRGSEGIRPCSSAVERVCLFSLSLRVRIIKEKSSASDWGGPIPADWRPPTQVSKTPGICCCNPLRFQDFFVTQLKVVKGD